jgi:transcriptional regulator with XRE-family HTH domain
MSDVHSIEHRVQYTTENDVSTKLNKDNSVLNTFTVMLSHVVKSQPTAFQELLAWAKSQGRSYRVIEERGGKAITFSNIGNLVKKGSAANPNLDTIVALAKGIGVPVAVVVDALMGIRTGETPALRNDALRETLAQYEELGEAERRELKVFIESLTNAVKSAHAAREEHQAALLDRKHS